MALVATTAAGFGIWVGDMPSGRRAQLYLAKAEEFRRAEHDHRGWAGGHFNPDTPIEVVIELRREWERGLGKEMMRREDRMADYYRDLARKYRLAADHPGEPIEPDPPPPEPRRIVSRKR
jgi:hypothetical protein